MNFIINKYKRAFSYQDAAVRKDEESEEDDE